MYTRWNSNKVCVIFQVCVVFSRVRIAFQKALEVKHRMYFMRPYQYLSSSLMGHIDFQIVNINEVPKTKKHHLRVNQKLINHVLLALM